MKRLVAVALGCVLVLAMHPAVATSGGHGHGAIAQQFASQDPLWDELKRFAASPGSRVPAYLRLHAGQWSQPLAYTRQMLSMSDAMLGRYAQAEAEMVQAFGGKPVLPEPCPADLGSDSLEAWLTEHAGQVDLVMTHEAHNQPISRALVYQMLPVMRRLGFSILALEALPDDATTEAINRDGYVRDRATYGYYLREPIEGEIIRRARKLGFTLARYDDFSEGDRELHQATHLAQLLRSNRGKKVFVVAGYDHIRRIDGRMAQRLPTMYPERFLSIGQLGAGQGNDAMHGLCSPRTAAPSGSEGSSSTLSSVRWMPGGRGTDITAFRVGRFSLDRATPDGAAWLSLGGERSRYRFDTAKACGRSSACLIEARYADEPADAVPADRYLALGKESAAFLYLKDGRYVITYRDHSGKQQRSETVVLQAGQLHP